MAGRSRLAACMLVLALAGCGSGATDGPAAEESSLPTPSPSASSSAAPLVDAPSPADVVDDADARLVDVAVAPGGPGVRAAVWSTCPAPDCSARHVAVAVTADDSTSRVVADRVWRSVPAVAVDDQGNAVVTAYGRRVELTLVRPDGTTTDVRRSREEAPVDPGEIVAGVEHSARGTSFYATRPADATGHPVPVLPDTQVLRQLPSGQLRAITRQRTYAWSDDGGATWAESAGASEGALLQSFVTSAPDVHVLVAGGDGATLFPFGEIRRLGGMGTWSVTPLPRTPRAYIGATAVLPDGRFLADVDAWSDNRRQGGRLRGTPPGLYVSDGDDWASYAPLELGAPFTGTAHHLPDVRQVDVTGARTSIGAIGPDGRSWWTSTDLGATWTEQRAR